MSLEALPDGEHWIRVYRVGRRGEWCGEVLNRDGLDVYKTLRIGGEGAKARAAQICRSWVAKFATPNPGPTEQEGSE